MSLPLFDHALAQRRRDRGIALAADAQDRTTPGWGDYAYDTIKLVAQRQATVHVDDVLRIFNVRPAHPNCWGAPWQRAIKDGVIARTGTVRPSADAKKNAHQYPVYRSLLFR